MRTAMSLEQFAALVRIEPAQIREWADIGLLDPAREGRFDDFDLLRLMAIRHYEALGYDAERLAAGIRSGAIEPFLGEYIYPRSQQLTMDEAADRVGLDRELLAEVLTALGWVRSGIVEEDLRMLEGFKAIAGAGMPREAVLEGARAFGDTLGRLAEALVRLVHVHIHERLLEEGLSEEDVARHIHGVQEAALPLLDRIVERVHHEHFLRADIEDAYVHLVDTDPVGGRGSVDTTIMFIDVESFTQLTETEGDQAAVDTMTHVDSVVRPLALRHDGKVVKSIGDALMLAFREPADAASFAEALHEAARDDDSLPGLRVGMHSGPAIYRAGDYIGTTVNLASRVTSTATAGQTVLTEAVAQNLGEGAPVQTRRRQNAARLRAPRGALPPHPARAATGPGLRPVRGGAARRAPTTGARGAVVLLRGMPPQVSRAHASNYLVSSNRDLPPLRLRLLGQGISLAIARAPVIWRVLRRPTERFFERSAATWDERTKPDRPEHLAPLAAACELLDPEPQAILELGTGTGAGAVMLARRFPEAHVCAVDLSRAMIAAARAKLPHDVAKRIEFAVADAASLPFPDQTFDVVAQLNVPVYLDETARVLKPGGHLIVGSSLGPATPYYTRDALLAKRCKHLGLDPVRTGESYGGTYFLARRRKDGAP